MKVSLGERHGRSQLLPRTHDERRRSIHARHRFGRIPSTVLHVLFNYDVSKDDGSRGSNPGQRWGESDIGQARFQAKHCQEHALIDGVMRHVSVKTQSAHVPPR